MHRKAGWPDGKTLRFSCFMDPDFLSILLNVDDRMERRKWRDWRRQGKGLAVQTPGVSDWFRQQTMGAPE
jgi:alkyl hydroperoxide reductase subunit AhpC